MSGDMHVPAFMPTFTQVTPTSPRALNPYSGNTEHHVSYFFFYFFF